MVWIKIKKAGCYLESEDGGFDIVIITTFITPDHSTFRDPREFNFKNKALLINFLTFPDDPNRFPLNEYDPGDIAMLDEFLKILEVETPASFIYVRFGSLVEVIQLGLCLEPDASESIKGMVTCFKANLDGKQVIERLKEVLKSEEDVYILSED